MLDLALAIAVMTADTPCWMEAGDGTFIDLSALCGGGGVEIAPPVPQSGVTDANFANALMGLIGNMPPSITIELLALRDLPGIGRAYCDAVAQGATQEAITNAFAQAYGLSFDAAASLTIALQVTAPQYLC